MRRVVLWVLFLVAAILSGLLVGFALLGVLPRDIEGLAAASHSVFASLA